MIKPRNNENYEALKKALYLLFVCRNSSTGYDNKVRPYKVIIPNVNYIFKETEKFYLKSSNNNGIDESINYAQTYGLNTMMTYDEIRDIN
ncbi:hypothetical protein RhiirA4_475203 [Rhizophagus irregularis]|uniref:Uncharacterized protein n=1 Tax=Rhizophagus irregularis TaxID=588596 RepID=A0A2I1H9S2_9GLOM|nr:hypothetical protein RhiirA4_475203 [Rhizophagus irregularis]